MEHGYLRETFEIALRAILTTVVIAGPLFMLAWLIWKGM